jgi:hypothetical protein
LYLAYVPHNLKIYLETQINDSTLIQGTFDFLYRIRGALQTQLQRISSHRHIMQVTISLPKHPSF